MNLRVVRRLAGQLGLAMAAWTLVGVLSYAREPLGAWLARGSAQPWRAALPDLTSCWLWALFTPPILWLAERYPLDRGSWWRHLPVHVAAAAASVLLGAPVLHWTWTALGLKHSATLTMQMIRELFIDVFSYAGLLALGHAFNYRRLSAAQRLRASELEAKLLAARIEALQARLHPHFLFNALNTVSSLIRTGEVQAAVRAVARLGDLLRALLSEDSREVTLSRELDFVGRYLELEQARFGDRLQVRIDVSPGVLGALVPPLVLQPLVENALRHGIEPSPLPGQVVVRAARAGERLELEVRDTGARVARRSSSSRLGLATTRARLAQLYGDRQELTLVTSGDQTIARVRIPFRASEGTE